MKKVRCISVDTVLPGDFQRKPPTWCGCWPILAAVQEYGSFCWGARAVLRVPLLTPVSRIAQAVQERGRCLLGVKPADAWGCILLPDLCDGGQLVPTAGRYGLTPTWATCLPSITGVRLNERPPRALLQLHKSAGYQRPCCHTAWWRPGCVLLPCALRLTAVCFPCSRTAIRTSLCLGKGAMLSELGGRAADNSPGWRPKQSCCFMLTRFCEQPRISVGRFLWRPSVHSGRIQVALFRILFGTQPSKQRVMKSSAAISLAKFIWVQAE